MIDNEQINKNHFQQQFTLPGRIPEDRKYWFVCTHCGTMYNPCHDVITDDDCIVLINAHGINKSDYNGYPCDVCNHRISYRIINVSELYNVI